MSDMKDEKKPQQEEHYSLNDDRRVKVLSPGALVAKRFFRNRLAVLGMVMLLVMFVFSFVGGLVSPYGQDEQFYTRVDEIPTVRFDEAKRLVSEAYDRPIRDPYDLEPEEEHNIGRYFKEKYGADFVFVTHYPSKKRPFYAMDDPEDPKYTLSFDLLFRGLEVTTGGQRIHDYDQQVQKMLDRGMHPEEFESYLMIHKHGMPPHGGLGIGLERLTAQLCGLDNVRYASLFPRDLHRMEP